MLNKLKNAAWLVLGGIVLFWALTTLVGIVQGGPLDPPEPVAPTQRTQITSLPFRIDKPGSYVVMKDLTCTSCGTGQADAGANGISIYESDVTLDLNGFTLRGVDGSANGIQVLSVAGLTNIAIYNGTVKGWQSHGVEAVNARNSQFHNLRLHDNGLDGINVGDNSVVSACTATFNSGDGVRVGEGSVVADCVSSLNGGGGIVAGLHSIVRNCSATYNRDGIITSSGTRVSNCTASKNDFGILVFGSGNYVTGNVASNNGDTGILVPSDTVRNRIEGNTVIGGPHGIVVLGAGNLIIKNSATGQSLSDYTFVAGNTVGATVTGPGTIGQLTVIPDSPWANFSY